MIVTGTRRHKMPTVRSLALDFRRIFPHVLDTWLNGMVWCAEDEAALKDSRYHLKSVSAETRSILDELDRTYSAPVTALSVRGSDVITALVLIEERTVSFSSFQRPFLQVELG